MELLLSLSALFHIVLILRKISKSSALFDTVLDARE